MIYLILWWFMLLLLGFAALPMTMRFLRFLPDRGYAFAKPLALLVWVYPFWLLGVLGFLHNTFGALAFLLVVLALASWTLLRGRGNDSVITWLRTHWRYVLVVEIVFGMAMLAFAYFRAFNPEISGTEKPMEFMFLNSILQSDTFPPHDAWLSGFAISYYYLGYVIVAALAKLGNIPSEYAFNMGLIMTYALAAVSAFGLIFNLVSHAQKNGETAETRPSLAPYAFGILAVFMLLVVGNLEGAVEVSYNADYIPRDTVASLNLHGLEDVQPSGTLIPQDNWWWWRASRVLNDVNPTGQHEEVIDEFPAFSFLLGDLHPHVLSLPFCILALAVAFSLLLGRSSFAVSRQPSPDNLQSPVISQQSLGDGLYRTNLQTLPAILFTPRMLLTALIVGALGMLNTWDIVTYGFVIVAAFVISQFRTAGKLSPQVIISSIAFLLVLFAGAFLLFLPFYLGFSSQAHGITPEIFNKTPLLSYLIMFGLFVFVILTLLIQLLGWQLVLPFAAGAIGGAVVGYLLAYLPISSSYPFLTFEVLIGLGSIIGFAIAVLIFFFGSYKPILSDLANLSLLMILVPFSIALIGLVVLQISPSLQSQLSGALPLNPGESVAGALLGAFFKALLSNPGVFLLLTFLIAGTVAIGRFILSSEDLPALAGFDRTTILFVLLMVLVGLALTFGVEFLYIRDTFESRMNTVFKLYYQGWLLLAMAATFGVYYLWKSIRGPARAVWLGAFALIFCLSLIYPALAYPNKANYFNAKQTPPTLDGWAWVRNSFPDDYAGIVWARANIPSNAVILEGAGNQYSFDNRVSVATGLSTVLGWGGHELQWRGNSKESDPRSQDIETIYKSRDLKKTRELLDKYEVAFVVVGDIEKNKYNLAPPSIDKFGKLGEKVFEQGTMRIYRVGQVSVSIRTP